MVDKKKEMEKEKGFTVSEEDAKRLELLAANFLTARGYAVFDGDLAAQMLALVSKNN